MEANLTNLTALITTALQEGWWGGWVVEEEFIEVDTDTDTDTEFPVAAAEEIRREFCEDRAEAARHGQDALDALARAEGMEGEDRAGALADALAALEWAARIERKWGDTPAWGAALNIGERLISAVDAADAYQEVR